MMKIVVLACFLAVAVANPADTVISIDQENHKHTQSGEAGTAVTGSYEVLGVDGVLRVVNYIADDKGFRVVGNGKVDAPAPAPAPAPVTYAPATSPPIGYPAATSPPDVYLPPEDQSFFNAFNSQKPQELPIGKLMSPLAKGRDVPAPCRRYFMPTSHATHLRSPIYGGMGCGDRESGGVSAALFSLYVCHKAKSKSKYTAKALNTAKPNTALCATCRKIRDADCFWVMDLAETFSELSSGATAII